MNHAVIQCDSDGVVLLDKGSLNKTKLNKVITNNFKFYSALHVLTYSIYLLEKSQERCCVLP